MFKTRLETWETWRASKAKKDKLSWLGMTDGTYEGAWIKWSDDQTSLSGIWEKL